jgi:hypothetical protein
MTETKTTKTKTSSLSAKHRPFLYIARTRRKRGPILLPEGYKRRKNTTTVGVAKTGEVSPKGTVSHTEDWEGRVAAEAAPTSVHYVRDPDGRWRPMTIQEMIERGLFTPGEGPTGHKATGGQRVRK